MLTVAEEQIVEAAGLTAAVAGLVNVKCFGSATNQSSTKLMIEVILMKTTKVVQYPN